MTETLYVALDLFHAASYVPRQAHRPPIHTAKDESYAHDVGRISFVLQPFLIEGLSSDSSPDLPTYLGWDAARLGQPGTVRFLSSHAVTAIFAGAANPVITPVPFPPMTLLDFDATWSGDGKLTVSR